MIPVKDVRKLLYITTSQKSLTDFQTMFVGVVSVELLNVATSGDYFYAVEFSHEVDGLTVYKGALGRNNKINLINGGVVYAGEIAEGAKIPLYFITYIRD